MAKKYKTKNKKKNKTKKRRNKKPILFIERFREIPSWFWHILFLFFLLLLLLVLGNMVKKYDKKRKFLSFDVINISIKGLPEWIDARSRKELVSPAVKGIPGTVNVLDRKLLEKLNVFYQNDDWVKDVKSISYIFPGLNTLGGIEAHLKLKEPLCAVKSLEKDSFFLVDLQGKRLGYSLQKLSADKLHLPIVYFAEKIPAHPGDSDWDDKVFHGFYMALLLNENKLRYGLPHWIMQIDVRNVGNRRESEVVLSTENKATILWGRTVRAENEGRPQLTDVVLKIKRLRLILSGKVKFSEGDEFDINRPLEGFED